MSNEKKTGELLRKLGAWQTGHFLLSSGLHSDQYLQCQKILQYPRYGMVLAEELARAVLDSGLRPEAVVGPALGAVHWGQLVAIALDKAMAGKPVRAIFAERPGTSPDFEIRRGVEIEAGEKILVVEDVTTTGGSARQVIALLKRLGAEPAATGAIVDRSGGTVDFGMPFHALLKLDLKTYAPPECPLCRTGTPLVKPGSSKK